MPPARPKRRSSSGPTAAKPTSQQSTLTFHGHSNKVTKPSTTTHSNKFKTAKPDPQKLSPESKATHTPPPPSSTTVELVSDHKPEPETKPESEPEPNDPTTAEAAITSQTFQQPEATKLQQPESERTAETEEDKAARKITDAQVKQYWRSKEANRKAARVHQEALSLHEKVLREWDISGVYGPCIGIPRLSRWKRAHKLGLNPPVEVLAVLLKEQDRARGQGGIVKAQRAYVDELMSSRFVET